MTDAKRPVKAAGSTGSLDSGADEVDGGAAEVDAASGSGEGRGGDDESGGPMFQVLLPWRFIRRAVQPPPLVIGGITVGVDVYDADEEPLSPVEELLFTGIREHLGFR